MKQNYQIILLATFTSVEEHKHEIMKMYTAYLIATINDFEHYQIFHFILKIYDMFYHTKVLSNVLDFTIL